MRQTVDRKCSTRADRRESIISLITIDQITSHHITNFQNYRSLFQPRRSRAPVGESPQSHHALSSEFWRRSLMIIKLERLVLLAIGPLSLFRAQQSVLSSAITFAFRLFAVIAHHCNFRMLNSHHRDPFAVWPMDLAFGFLRRIYIEFFGPK